MAEFIRLLAVDQVMSGKSVKAHVDGRYYAVSNDGGRIYVTDFVCPHAGAALGGANVRDGHLICPLHHWPWDLSNGLTDPRFPELRLRIYPCEVRDGFVYAAITHEPDDERHDLDAHLS